MENEKASIIIPTSNRKNLLYLVLLALNFQNNLDFEVIVIDDGSTDGTKELIREWNGPYEIKYFYFDKFLGTGAAAARNQGLKLCNNDIVIFLDSDSLVQPNFVEQHLRCHRYKNHLAVVGPRWQLKEQVLDEDKIKNGFDKDSLQIDCLEEQNRLFYYSSQNIGQFLLPWWFFSTSNASARISDIEKAGWFDEEFCQYILYEDTELAFRLYNNQVRFIYIQQTECFHIYHPINKVEKLELSKGSIRYFQSKYPNMPEVKNLNIIADTKWDKASVEGPQWIKYLTSVCKEKHIEGRKILRRYSAIVHDDEVEMLLHWIEMFNKNAKSHNTQINIYDCTNTGHLDIDIQLMNTDIKLDYFKFNQENEKEIINHINQKKVLFSI